MTPDDDNESVLYEVNLEADLGIEASFDTWLRDHIADMLQFDGFLSAEILDDAGGAPTGRLRRTVQYRLRDQTALDAYLRDHAPRMRTHGVQKFGDRFSTDRRVLAHREEFIRGSFSTENCLNCGEVLRGQHCSHCGQRAKVRVLSMGTLTRDLVGDLMNLDSQVWRTLKPLAFSPGTLTLDFLRGRRTHYSPPFRMYLVLSVVFFLLTSVGDLNFEVANNETGGANVIGGGADEAPPAPPAPTPATAGSTSAESKGADAAKSELDADRKRIIDQIVKHLPEQNQEEARRELSQDLGKMSAEQIAPMKRIADDPCGPDNLKIEVGFVSEAFEDRARDACRKIAADGKGFGRAVYENIPKMMFIFLPLIAAVMFVLYLGSGRYYVEHLLFFVHFHAFFFLGGITILLLEKTSNRLADTTVGSWVTSAENLLTFGLIVYVPYYLYRAMRRVYGQGRGVTLAKFSMLLVGYLVFMTLTVLGLLAYTALTL